MSLACDGGFVESAFMWVSNNGGMASEKNYPYNYTRGSTYTCKTASIVNDPKTAPIASNPFTRVPSTVSMFMSAVYQQPISIAIQVTIAICSIL